MAKKMLTQNRLALLLLFILLAFLQQGTSNGAQPTPWRTSNAVVAGWDWSLPPYVKPAPSSGLIYRKGDTISLPGNKLVDVGIFWRELEPEEGKYNFAPLREQLENLPEDCAGYRLHIYASVARKDFWDKKTGEKVEHYSQRTAPLWLKKYDIPTLAMDKVDNGFQLVNYAIWHPAYHSRYLKLVKALGKSGVLGITGRVPQARIIYIGGMSKSWGDEMYIPQKLYPKFEKEAGLSPQKLEQCLKERLAAWAQAAGKNVDRLAWVGAGTDSGGNEAYRSVGPNVLRYAYQLGMGQRCGFVENYLYHLSNPLLGQSVNEEGYSIVDETLPAIAEKRAFGDENEEYGPFWVTRFGPMETHPPRYLDSMLRSLQMRRNFLWMGSSTKTDINPELTAYISLTLGRDISDTPDAFCYLRESSVYSQATGRKPGQKAAAVKNFERWLKQRDIPGAMTVAVHKEPQHSGLWMVPKDKKYNYVARRTDVATGNNKIAFDLDDRFEKPFIAGKKERVIPTRYAIKVTYYDTGNGSWSLVWKKENGGEGRAKVLLHDTNKLKTATLFVDGMAIQRKGNKKAEAFSTDFWIEANEIDAVVRLVRVVRLP